MNNTMLSLLLYSFYQWGRTALMYAASKGHVDIVNHILTRDTEEVNAQNNHVR